MTDTNTNSPSVCFVLPCLNEAKTIEWCVDRARQALDILIETHGLTGEVIVADNGSDDGSQDLARASGARVVDVDTRGYGAALIGGFEAADATYLVMGDSDCSYDFLEAVPMVEKLMEGADFCMGSRFKGEIKPGAMPWKNRYIGNPVLSGMLKFLFRTKISDSHCGLRAITGNAYRGLNLSSTGMEFASEMVLKAVLHDIKIAEVPVTLSPDKRGRPPHLNPWRDGLRHLVYMLLLSPKHLFMWPALLLFVFAITIFTVLLSSGGAPLATFAGFQVGDHFAVVAGAAMIISVQTAIMGMFATIFSIQRGFRKPSTRVLRFLKFSKLEYWVISGMCLILGGVTWAAIITGQWIASDYGGLHKIRDMMAAATMSVAGFQLFFSGCLLSIFAGGRFAHSEAL